MKLYELSLGFAQALVLVFSWILISMGYPAFSVYLVAIFINIVMLVIRLAIASYLTGLPSGAFLRVVGLPVLLVVGVSSALVLAIVDFMPDLDQSFFSTKGVAAAGLVGLLPAVVVYALGLSQDERNSVHAMIQKRSARFGIGR
ncbi:hypothetical protein NRB_11990 [Novosphingobium sp. 11B]